MWKRLIGERRRHRIEIVSPDGAECSPSVNRDDMGRGSGHGTIPADVLIQFLLQIYKAFER